MIKSRLINCYLALDKTELRQLKLWINSPIHNQHQDVIKLFNFLDSRAKITKVTVQKSRAFKYIFPNQEYKEEKLRVVMAYALNILKKFVGYNQVVSDFFIQQKKTIQGLHDHNLLDLANLELNKLNKQLTKAPLLNANKSLQLFQLEQENFQLKGTQNRTIQTNLPNIFNHLTDFYILSMLKYACIANSHSNVTSQNYDIPMLTVILTTAQQSEHPILQLYYHLYSSSNNQAKNDTAFEMAGDLFSKHYELLSHQEQNEVLQLLINYCIKKRLSRDSDFFVKMGFDWYRWGLEQKILIKKGTLSRFAYMNIVGMGLNLLEFDWVANFIPQYVNYLPLKFRENYQHYTTSKLYFKQKNYDQAQRLLTQVEYDDIFLNLDAKTSLLIIYYEEKSWDALEALLVSFSRYLQRKQIIAYHKQVYQNIIMLTRKLMALTPYNKKAKKALIEEIKTTNPLAERDWLLLQIELL